MVLHLRHCRSLGVGKHRGAEAREDFGSAQDLYDLANCDRRRMSGHTGQKQDTEDGGRWAKSSTHHRFEIPPRYLSHNYEWGKVCIV